MHPPSLAQIWISTSRVHIIERKKEDLLSRESPESGDIVSFLVCADMDGG